MRVRSRNVTVTGLLGKDAFPKVLVDARELCSAMLMLMQFVCFKPVDAELRTCGIRNPGDQSGMDCFSA